MSGEIFHDPDIGNSCWKNPLATGRDLINIAELAIFDTLAHFLESGVIAFDIAHRAHKTL